MYEANSNGIQRNLSAVLAALIVAAGGLIFNGAHLASAPKGTIEVGQLTLIEAPAQVATLPEIVVTAKRA